MFSLTCGSIYFKIFYYCFLIKKISVKSIFIEVLKQYDTPVLDRYHKNKIISKKIKV